MPFSIPQALEAAIAGLPSSAEIRGLPPSVQHRALESPLPLALWNPRNEDNKAQYLCPLCPGRHPSAGHFENVHWKFRVHVQRWTVFPCHHRHGKFRTRHFHCPLCASLFPESAALATHVTELHPSEEPGSRESEIIPWYSGISETWEEHTGQEDRKFVLRPHPSPVVVATPLHSVRFAATVEISGFPLAVSLAEKRGSVLGDAPRTRPAKYVTVSAVPLWITGASETTDLFRDCVFLLVGRIFSPTVLTEISRHSGEISGAQYLGGLEWTRFTHVLLGSEICPEKISQLWPKLAPLTFVDQFWVRDSVDAGVLLVAPDLKIRIQTLLDNFSPVSTAVVPEHPQTPVHGQDRDQLLN